MAQRNGFITGPGMASVTRENTLPLTEGRDPGVGLHVMAQSNGFITGPGMASVTRENTLPLQREEIQVYRPACYGAE
jgi:hypothetical protein